ncbi:MAG TPA: hypothetical protein VII52_13345 [Gemmatimonadaceae bacterium]
MSKLVLDAVRRSGGLSLTAIARIERRFAEALRHRPAARINLRLAVRYLVLELHAQGVSSDVTRRLVEYIVEHHPDRDDLDHTSMVSGLRESDVIVAQMREWVTELHANLTILRAGEVEPRRSIFPPLTAREFT